MCQGALDLIPSYNSAVGRGQKEGDQRNSVDKFHIIPIGCSTKDWEVDCVREVNMWQPASSTITQTQIYVQNGNIIEDGILCLLCFESIVFFNFMEIYVL